MKFKANSYMSFLKELRKEQPLLLPQKAPEILEHFLPTRQKTSPFGPTTFLLDYTSKQYIYVDPSCFDLLGYKAGYFLEAGLEAYISKWHPDDFYVLDRLIIPDNISFLQTIDTAVYSEYIFSYNYRILNAAGSYKTVLQRFSYIPGKGSLPVGVIGVVFDITHYKSDTSIVHTIERAVDCGNETVNELVYKKVHPVVKGATNGLTKKERHILSFIALGLSSKQIADKLNLSINTVHNHRRNMLAKTCCHSCSELVKYALNRGLLQLD